MIERIEVLQHHDSPIVSAMAAKILSLPVAPKFFDSASLPKDNMQRFVIEQSGLDLQLSISR